MDDVKGKVAFITGGASGIGLGIAKVFAAAGMKVALSWRTKKHLDEAMAYFAKHPALAVHPIKLDVTDRQAMARAADEVVAKFGKVHVLVNNAGVSLFGPTDEATYDDYDWVMGVNFGGVVNGLVSFLPKIKAHGEGGHVINVASMASFLPGPQGGIYTAAKFAVRGLSECIRYNLAPHNIGVSLMCPGLTKTNIHEATLHRPEKWPRTAFPADKNFVHMLEELHSAGMDPVEVGEKTLRGMLRGDFYIFSHPEFHEEFLELFDEYDRALPNEPPDPRRVAIEEQRRQARRDAAKSVIHVQDLLVKGDAETPR
jgi:NAD(P)-dependent dehydrogenase (short-subunit alcohol dehydrogenase family)